MAMALPSGHSALDTESAFQVINLGKMKEGSIEHLNKSLLNFL